MNDTPEANRKVRRKATTQVGRSIMQRERQRMAREQAQLGEALVKESQIRQGLAERYTHDVEHNALCRGIVKRIAAVLASEDVNVPLFVMKGTEGAGLNAWTDFTRISVTYPPLEDKRVLAAVLRALLYHEAGHCRFSLPPRILWEQVKKAYAAAGVEMPHGLDLDTVFRAWNSLEDQRMETAVVTDSPRKAAYLTPLIMSVHTKTIAAASANYPLLVWRRYLPRELRAHARKMFVAEHNLIGMDGEAVARECEEIVTRYVLANDVITMWEAVVDMHLFLRTIKPLACKDFGHDRQRGGRPVDAKDLDDYLIIPIQQDMVDEPPLGPEPQDVPEDEPEADEPDYSDPEVAEHIIDTLIAMWWHPETLVPVVYAPQGGNVVDNKDDDAAPPQPSEPGEEQDEPEEGADGAGDGEHSDDGADNTDGGDFGQDDLDKMLQDAEDERNELSELDEDMRSFDNARDQVSQLPVYIGGLSNDGAAVSKAMAVADEIERSFQTHTMDRQPAWVEGQRRGMLNVLRYQTRRPGEVEIFRQWTDDEMPGYDIAVSVLLDYSGSMDWALVELAQAGYAAKLACHRLGIPCTVTLWDTKAKVLFDANEQPLGLPVLKEDGGTDPTVALNDLDNQRFDRAKHIVLIMTDGDWQHWDKRTVASYKEPGRSIFGFGFGSSYIARNLIGYGCDDAFAIRDLMEIPRRLEQFLVAAA